MHWLNASADRCRVFGAASDLERLVNACRHFWMLSLCAINPLDPSCTKTLQQPVAAVAIQAGQGYQGCTQ